MLGTYRFVLALLVVLSHTGLRGAFNIDRFNFGIWAVISFFLLSGYVMPALIHKFEGHGFSLVRRFYADRFLRIYPQYFFFLCLTLIVVVTIHVPVAFLHLSIDFPKVLSNFLLIPMNYSFDIPWLMHYQLIPPSWSLASEAQFYFLFPFLYFFPIFRRVAWVSSLIIFGLGVFGVLPRDNFTFIYFPGVLFIFILGMRLYEVRNVPFSHWAIRSTYALLLLWVCYLYYCDVIWLGHLREIFSGILFGVPILHCLGTLPRRKWDSILGNATYGIFLSHQLVIWINRQHIQITNQAIRLPFIFLTSIALGFMGYYLIEKPYEAIRANIRKNRKVKLTPLGSTACV